MPGRLLALVEKCQCLLPLHLLLRRRRRRRRRFTSSLSDTLEDEKQDKTERDPDEPGLPAEIFALPAKRPPTRRPSTRRRDLLLDGCGDL